MNKKEQAFIDSISSETFSGMCEEIWAEENYPLFGDMGAIIDEQYNNEAIDRLIANGYETGQIQEEGDEEVED